MTQSFSSGRSDEDGDLQEHVVHIRRVAKVTKGGRHLTFNAMVIVGDGKGKVGAGLGKGAAVPDAVRKGNTIARRNMVTVPLNGSTVPHRVIAKFGASEVLIKPAKPGSGVKAGGAVRAVMEAVGIRDVVTKALGSRNPINVVKATISGLMSMQGALEAGEGPTRTGAILPPVPADRRGPLRREGGGGFRGRDRDRDRRGPPRDRDRDRDRNRDARPPAPPSAAAPSLAAPAISEAPSDG